MTLKDGTIEGCVWGAHDSYHGFVIRLVRKHLKTSSPVFFFSGNQLIHCDRLLITIANNYNYLNINLLNVLID